MKTFVILGVLIFRFNVFWTKDQNEFGKGFTSNLWGSSWDPGDDALPADIQKEKKPRRGRVPALYQ